MATRIKTRQNSFPNRIDYNLNSLIVMFFELDFPKSLSDPDFMLKMLCYIPQRQEIRINDNKKKGEEGKTLIIEIDHFTHFENNLLYSEEDEILETGEFVFLWQAFEKVYSDLSMMKFSDVKKKNIF